MRTSGLNTGARVRARTAPSSPLAIDISLLLHFLLREELIVPSSEARHSVAFACQDGSVPIPANGLKSILGIPCTALLRMKAAEVDGPSGIRKFRRRSKRTPSEAIRWPANR